MGERSRQGGRCCTPMNKVKTALDETRLLILGAQVLFGFQLQSVFQDAFSGLSAAARNLDCAGQVLMAVAIGLLIAPSMQHRIVENGEDSPRIHRVTGLFAGLSLMPFAISLGLSFFIVFDHLFGPAAAIAAGAIFCALAGSFWYGLGLMVKRTSMTPMPAQEKPTPLPTKIDQMLTEARVILPGAQALLGFQLTVTLTRSFEQLAAASRLLHIAALCCVAVAVILLMTPAALHRIAFAGEDSPSFLRMGSWFVVTAPIPLALGIGADLYVATAQAAGSPDVSAVLALAVLGILVALWYVLPIVMRARGRR